MPFRFHDSLVHVSIFTLVHFYHFFATPFAHNICHSAPVACMTPAQRLIPPDCPLYLPLVHSFRVLHPPPDLPSPSHLLLLHRSRSGYWLVAKRPRQRQSAFTVSWSCLLFDRRVYMCPDLGAPNVFIVALQVTQRTLMRRDDVQERVRGARVTRNQGQEGTYD